MPWSLKRFQSTKKLHFVTFSCDHRAPHLREPATRDLFEAVLEQVRQRFAFPLVGYVVMPEHVHLLTVEPEDVPLSVALQILKQTASRKAREFEFHFVAPFWERRYYDFNVWSERKRIEKLRYMHRNPVQRGLVTSPEGWKWGSFRHYALGERGTVRIDSDWAEYWRVQRK